MGFPGGRLPSSVCRSSLRADEDLRAYSSVAVATHGCLMYLRWAFLKYLRHKACSLTFS